jgi:hypothetical protein
MLGLALRAAGRKVKPRSSPGLKYLLVRLELSSFFVWFCRFLRTKLAHLCCMLVAQEIEPLRDSQIERLPCELVTPVRLPAKETQVLHSDLPCTPKPSSALLGQGVLIRLMQPRIAFEILTFLPSPFLSLVLPPSSFARAPWLGRQAPEIGE